MSIVLPILFNTDMVRAIMDGRKTVTRRVIKPQPTEHLTCVENWEQLLVAAAAPYQPGDILYVRETWGISNLDYDGKISYIVYKASENEKDEGCRAVRLPEYKFEKLYDSMSESSPYWHPSIHMPKEAARIWLKVKDVRVERLQEITTQQICCEGVETEYPYVLNGTEKIYAFQQLWNSTIKKSDVDRYGWNANPWVWVIEFERCENPYNF